MVVASCSRMESPSCCTAGRGDAIVAGGVAVSSGMSWSPHCASALNFFALPLHYATSSGLKPGMALALVGLWRSSVDAVGPRACSSRPT